MLYIPSKFKLWELLPQRFYEECIADNVPEYKLWSMFDGRMLYTADQLRERFGPMLVNTWRYGGSFQFRGWRPWDCKIGARLSQHKFGRAPDLDPRDVSPEEIRADIIAQSKDPKLWFSGPYRYITCIEAGTPTWLHFDVRNWDVAKSGLLIVNP